MKVPGPTVEQIVPWVKPIYGEPLRYHVRSRSRPHEVHLVDLAENGFYGMCSCEEFKFKFQKKINSLGIPLNNSLQCWHIRMADKHFNATFKRAVWMRLNPEPEKKPKPEPPAEKPVQCARPQPKTYYLKPHGH